jgi:hypothetical protein
MTGLDSNAWYTNIRNDEKQRQVNGDPDVAGERQIQEGGNK